MQQSAPCAGCRASAPRTISHKHNTCHHLCAAAWPLCCQQLCCPACGHTGERRSTHVSKCCPRASNPTSMQQGQHPSLRVHADCLAALVCAHQHSLPCPALNLHRRTHAHSSKYLRARTDARTCTRQRARTCAQYPSQPGTGKMSTCRGHWLIRHQHGNICPPLLPDAAGSAAGPPVTHKQWFVPKVVGIG